MTITSLQRDVAALRQELQRATRDTVEFSRRERISELILRLEVFEVSNQISLETSWMHVDLLYCRDRYHQLMGISPSSVPSTKKRKVEVQKAPETSKEKKLVSKAIDPISFFYREGMSVFYQDMVWELKSYDETKKSCRLFNGAGGIERWISSAAVVYLPKIGDECFIREPLHNPAYEKEVPLKRGRKIYYKARVEALEFVSKPDKQSKNLKVTAILLEGAPVRKEFMIHSLDGILPSLNCPNPNQVLVPCTSSDDKKRAIYTLKYIKK